MADISTLEIMEALLRTLPRVTLDAAWPARTPQELGLDSLDLIELQMELESRCEVTLLEDDVTLSEGQTWTFGQLAQRIDALRK
jgi:acyl carrier protein